MQVDNYARNLHNSENYIYKERLILKLLFSGIRTAGYNIH